MSRQIARGAAWMVLFKVVDRLLGIVSTAVLARLLVPADFGLVAMAMSVIAVIELASAFSFEVALIQKDDPQRQHYDAAWTLNILLGLGCGALIAVMAQPAAAFYDEPRLVAVMLALSFGWFVGGFENVGTVEFRRSMDFGREFRFMATKRMVGFIVTLVLAFALRTYWALVVGTVVSRASAVLLSYLLHPYRPRFGLRTSRELFGFSGWLLVNNLLSVGILKAPHFFAGRLTGPTGLGLYTIASELGYTPATELMAPVNRALFPGFARLASDAAKFRATFLDVIAVITAVVIPASAGIAVVADPMVRVLLSERWLDSVPIIQVLAPAAAIVALTSNNVSAYFALGKTSLPPMILVVRVAVLLIALAFLGRSGGVMGIAQSELLAAIVSLSASLPILLRTLSLSTRSYFALVWRPLLASAVMGFAVHLLLEAMAAKESALWELGRLIAGMSTGVLVYAGTLWLLWRAAGRPHGAESILLGRLSDFVKTRTAQ